MLIDTHVLNNFIINTDNEQLYFVRLKLVHI